MTTVIVNVESRTSQLEVPVGEMSGRDRMVLAAVDMIGRHGLSATSIRKLAEASGEPLGSTYHYFPGGKKQLATEAVEYAGDAAAAWIGAALEGGPMAGVDAWIDMWRLILERSEFEAGCPVVAVSVEESETDLKPLARGTFDRWAGLFAAALVDAGHDEERAGHIATAVIAAVEGAVVLCRARRSTAPLDDVRAALALVVDAP